VARRAHAPGSGGPILKSHCMQIGVHPTTLGTFVLLSRFVRPLPIALRIPPQSAEGERESVNTVQRRIVTAV